MAGLRSNSSPLYRKDSATITISAVPPRGTEQIRAGAAMGLTPSALCRLGGEANSAETGEGSPSDGGRRRSTGATGGVNGRHSCNGCTSQMPLSGRPRGAGSASSREGLEQQAPPPVQWQQHSPTMQRPAPSARSPVGAGRRDISSRPAGSAVAAAAAAAAANAAAAVARGPDSGASGEEEAEAAALAGASPSPKPRVPPDVNAAFSIGHMLGSGAFGTVWEARHRDTGELVAMKILEKRRQLQEDFRLEPAEVEILKTVHHPNIVQLRDVFSTENCVYLVMELVLGGHLQVCLHARLLPCHKRVRPMPRVFRWLHTHPRATRAQARLKAQPHGCYDEPRAKLLLGQVIAAVHYLHERNIIHRDIKPENLLFADNTDILEGATVKLTDFGLSTMKEGRLTTRCGTPSYCAPELLSGEGYGKAVDMWSVGVLSYILLCGVLPFVGVDRNELFGKIRKGQYDFAGTGPAADVSELARDLVGRLLRLAPMERYSTRETLQHPWIVSAGQEDDGACGADGDGGDGDGAADGNGRRRWSLTSTESLDTVHEMMRRFNAERRLRRAFWVVVACGRFERSVGLRGGWPDDSDGGGSGGKGGGGGGGGGGGNGEMSGWAVDGPPPPPPPPDR